MEFEGRIVKVLPTRSGTGKNGEWKVLPFIFEYFENGEQRWPDRALLETMNHDHMRFIGQYVERGDDKKGIVESGCMKLKVAEIPCRCGFSHSVGEFTTKDGATGFTNRLRAYKVTASGAAASPPVAAPANQQPPFAHQTAQEPFPPIVDNDGLPF